jgi:hypothetical protein
LVDPREQAHYGYFKVYEDDDMVDDLDTCEWRQMLLLKSSDHRRLRALI